MTKHDLDVHHTATKNTHSVDVIAKGRDGDICRRMDGTLYLLTDGRTHPKHCEIEGDILKAIADHHREMVAMAYDGHGEPSAGCLAYSAYRAGMLDAGTGIEERWSDLAEWEQETWEAAARAVLDGVDVTS